jgi:hypothetical protein
MFYKLKNGSTITLINLDLVYSIEQRYNTIKFKYKFQGINERQYETLLIEHVDSFESNSVADAEKIIDDILRITNSHVPIASVSATTTSHQD